MTADNNSIKISGTLTTARKIFIDNIIIEKANGEFFLKLFAQKIWDKNTVCDSLHLLHLLFSLKKIFNSAPYMLVNMTTHTRESICFH